MDLFSALARPDPSDPQSNPILHWVYQGGDEWFACCGDLRDGQHLNYDFVEACRDGYEGLIVPAGWAQDVIKAHELGVVGVQRALLDLRAPNPAGTLLVVGGRNRDGWSRHDLKVVVIGRDASGNPVRVAGKEGKALLG